MLKNSQFSNKSFLAVNFLIIVGSIFTILLFTSPKALSVKATDYNYGRIIDDEVFYNKDTMSVQQIQAFLDKNIGHCDVWGTERNQYDRSITNAEYARRRGWAGPPYVCINKYHENPQTKETSFEKGGGAFEGGISAAQIIYNAAQKYGINPQVLLVLLRKESAGPVTDDRWPLKNQYKYAMGYACPDSGPGFSANCDNSKAGFYRQMELAAWQLKYYKDHPNDYSYKIGRNKIQYSPNPACGTRDVVIENIATLSLYIYTPYVPNEAALRNHPGTAHCGAYGNRNFFMFFNDWFGSTFVDKPESIGPITKSNADIEDGDYYININSMKTLDVKWASSENGAELNLWSKNGGKNQQFRLEKTNDGYHIIRSKLDHSKVLDLPGGRTKNKNPIKLWQYNGGCNQKWSIIKQNDGYTILSACNSLKGLSVNGDVKTDGSNIEIFDHQQKPIIWKFDQILPQDDIENNTIYRLSSNENTTLDVKWASSENGAELNLWSKNGGKNQQFRLEKIEKNLYIIRSELNNSKVLDLDNSNTKDGAKIHLWQYNGGCNQKWFLKKRSNNKFSITSSCNQLKSLDMFGGHIEKIGTPIKLWNYHGGPSQQWNLEKIK